MLDVLDLVAAEFTTILDGRLFDDPAGGQHAMRLLKMGLQPKRSSISLSQDYPFLLLYVRAGDDKASSSTFMVDLVAGFHIAPDRDGDGDVDGDDDLLTPAMETMTFLVTSFRKLQGGSYTPYSLEGIRWQVGDKDGAHPGPDNFMVAAELLFQQEPIF